jgi:hypothetical protein
MSGLFASITPSFHSWVIDLNKAIRLRAANQKHLRLSEFAMFNDLRTIFLTSFGVGPGAREGDQGVSKCRARPTLPGGREPSHNWNRGTCRAQHLNANTCMSVIAVGVEELTDDQTIQSRSLNQGLSRGQKFRRHFVWDPAAVVRSPTVHWTELAELLPSPPPSEFNNVEALDPPDSFLGFKACLHKTNWSSQPPGSILPRQPPLSNSTWWATGAALQAPLQPVLSLSHQVRSLGPLSADFTHSILSLAHQILNFALSQSLCSPLLPSCLSMPPPPARPFLLS